MMEKEYFEEMLKKACKECIEEDGEKLLKELEFVEQHKFSKKFENSIKNLIDSLQEMNKNG